MGLRLVGSEEKGLESAPPDLSPCDNPLARVNVAPRSPQMQPLSLAFPASGTVRNKFIFFLHYPILGTLVK